MAADIVNNGQIVENASLTWQEIDPALPNAKIKLMGPPPVSGTCDAFVELVMVASCRNFSKIADLSQDQQFKLCRTVRKDEAQD